MKSKTASLVAIAASAALGLTACGGGTPATDPTVTTPPRSVTTSAPSATTTSTTPTTASSTKASEESAAIALVQAHFAEYNKMLQSGSTTAFRATFEESCASCLGDATTNEAAFRNKQQLRGLEYAVTSLRVTFHDSRQVWVEGDLAQAGGQLVDASGTVIQTFTPTPAFRVLWRVTLGTPPMIFGSEIL